jgi:hypothetical protein
MAARPSPKLLAMAAISHGSCVQPSSQRCSLPPIPLCSRSSLCLLPMALVPTCSASGSGSPALLPVPSRVCADLCSFIPRACFSVPTRARSSLRTAARSLHPARALALRQHVAPCRFSARPWKSRFPAPSARDARPAMEFSRCSCSPSMAPSFFIFASQVWLSSAPSCSLIQVSARRRQARPSRPCLCTVFLSMLCCCRCCRARLARRFRMLGSLAACPSLVLAAGQSAPLSLPGHDLALLLTSLLAESLLSLRSLTARRCVVRRRVCSNIADSSMVPIDELCFIGLSPSVRHMCGRRIRSLLNPVVLELVISLSSEFSLDSCPRQLAPDSILSSFVHPTSMSVPTCCLRLMLAPTKESQEDVEKQAPGRCPKCSTESSNKSSIVILVHAKIRED